MLSRSVMSYSWGHHGPLPSRLACPRDFPWQEYWSGLRIFFSMGSSWPRGSKPHLLRLLHCRQILYHWATGESPVWWMGISKKRQKTHRQSVTWPEQQRLERYRGKQTPRAGATSSGPGEGREDSIQSLRGSPALLTAWSGTSGLQTCDGRHFHHFKLSSVWPLESNTHTEGNVTRIGHCRYCKRICNIAGKVTWRVLKATLYHSWGKKNRHYHVEAVEAFVLKSLTKASCSTHVILEPCYFENEMD